MIYDVLIVGGGPAGLSCALILGSAREKLYARDKTIGIIAHQKSAHLQSALLNNVLGIPAGTKGPEILKMGMEQLEQLYPHVDQITKEKCVRISADPSEVFQVQTNKAEYLAKKVVIAIGYSEFMHIEGLEAYTEPHPRTPESKKRLWLKNSDHRVADNLYVAGTLAGWRSQYAIAAGSGAHVATDILTDWNDGQHTKVHDKF